MIKNASSSVRKLFTTYPCGNIPFEDSALISLSAVPTRRVDFKILSAVNCSAEGIIIFKPLAAIFKPLSSLKPAMSIIACSSEVSLKSADVVNSFF